MSLGDIFEPGIFLGVTEIGCGAVEDDMHSVFREEETSNTGSASEFRAELNFTIDWFAAAAI